MRKKHREYAADQTWRTSGHGSNRRRKKNAWKALIVTGFFVILAAALVTFTRAIEREETKQLAALAENYEEESYEEESYDDGVYLYLFDQDYKYTDRIETYLIIGTDHSGNSEATGEDYQGSMADFLLLLILNKTKETYALLPVNRDTMTDVPVLDEDGNYVWRPTYQICNAHAFGTSKEQGCENITLAMSWFLGEMPIDGYYALPMDYIGILNHAVGGVTLTVEGDLVEEDPTLIAGETITLTDEQAFNYVHARVNVDDGENVSRMKRQKQFLQQFIKQAQELAGQDAGFAMGLINQLETYATTNISGNTISKLINRIQKYDNLGIFEIEGETKLGQALADGEDHTEFYVDEDSMLEVMTQLYGIVPVEE